ncbi:MULTISPECIES: ROK family transcriptional regulator [unclassified Streptomyces]|uniref:ROK family transcriptional regulator n=1 Tax=unclassified Streptomyces TaxID=2593676 RepID=UPI00344FDC77
MKGSVRRLNTEQVLALLRSGPISRAAIIARTGLSRATVSSIVAELLADGVVVDRPAAEERRAGPGRPTRLVVLSQGSVRSIGVAFQIASTAVAVADAQQQIVGTAVRSHRAALNWLDRARIAIEEVRRLYQEHGIEPTHLTGIGMGVAGPVGQSAPDAAWRVAADRLTAEFNAPVHVDNNLRLAALAETGWGTDLVTGSLLYFHLGEGVGAGIVIGGRLYRGATGAAGEVGHVRIDPEGPACRCGARGCLETYTALPVLLRRARVKRAGRPFSELAADPALAEELTRAAELCGRAVGAAVTTMDISRVVLGGMLAYAPPEAERAFTAALDAHLLPAMRESVQVGRARAGDTAAVTGALALVYHNSPILEGYHPYRTAPRDDAGGRIPPQEH